MTVKLASTKPATKQSQSEILERLIDARGIQDVFATGHSHIEDLPDGMKRVVFYVDETVYEYGGDGRKVTATIVAKIVLTEQALANLCNDSR